jgi:hypothetical protein
MSIYQTAARYGIAARSLERSVAEEVRELHKLAMDRRAASLASFLNRAKHLTIANTDAPVGGGERGGGERVAA